jgi:hypothetical protein
MKKQRPPRIDRLTLHRETLHLLETSRLHPARGGGSRPINSCPPGVCFPQTVASGCC